MTEVVNGRMQQWRSLFVWVAALVVCIGGSPVALAAQAGNGALMLIDAFGARAQGLGEAVSADTALGAEGMWWNPAALARMKSKEIGLHNTKSVFSSNNMLTVVIPSKVIGTLGAYAYIVDYGDSPSTDPNGGTNGILSNRSYVFSGTYATPVGERLSLGLSYKLVMWRIACSGFCNSLNVLSGSVSALDGGAQYALPTRFPLTLGLSVRNIGPGLKIKDAPQADPLPRIVQFGVSSRLPIKSLTESNASVDISADIVNADAYNGIGYALGTAFGYQDEYFLRAGYRKHAMMSGEPTIGFGFKRGAFGLDFSRRFDSFSDGLGAPPTFVTLRAQF